MEIIKIGEACDILNGFAFKSKNYVDSGIRIIRIANVQKGYIEDNTPAFYPLSTNGLDKYMLKSGDLLISLTGNVGRVALLDKEFLPAALNQRVACLRLKSNFIDKKYLFHILNSDFFEQKCIRSSKGVAQKNMSTEWLKEYEIPLYSAKEQQKIAATLDKLQSIITHRRTQLEKLDLLVKARFVEMFGDVATSDYKYPTKKLGDVANVGSSHRVFTKEFVETGIPFYRGTEIGELANGIQPKEPFYISEEHYKKIADDETRPKKGDLLMPSICNKGQVWRVDTDEPFYYKDGRVLCVSADRKIYNTIFLQFFMREKTIIEYPKIGSGSTFAEFKIFLLKDIDVLTPPLDLQTQFADFVKQVDKSRFITSKEKIRRVKFYDKF